MLDWLRNAFAVESDSAPPTEEERQLVDKLAREVVRRRLTTPAIAFLEMSVPMNYLGAQAMQFFSPMVTAIFDARGYEVFARFLERRDSLEILCRRIEQLEKSASDQEQVRNPSPPESGQP